MSTGFTPLPDACNYDCLIMIATSRVQLRYDHRLQAMAKLDFFGFCELMKGEIVIGKNGFLGTDG